MLYAMFLYTSVDLLLEIERKITEFSNHNQLEHSFEIMAKILSEPKLATDNYPSSSFMQELCGHQKWACPAWKAIMTLEAAGLKGTEYCCETI